MEKQPKIQGRIPGRKKVGQKIDVAMAKGRQWEKQPPYGCEFCDSIVISKNNT